MTFPVFVPPSLTSWSVTSLRGPGERNFNAVSHKPTRAPIQFSSICSRQLWFMGYGIKISFPRPPQWRHRSPGSQLWSTKPLHCTFAAMQRWNPQNAYVFPVPCCFSVSLKVLPKHYQRGFTWMITSQNFVHRLKSYLVLSCTVYFHSERVPHFLV